jgi:agmatine deiminase
MTKPPPSNLGFRLPAEWEPQAAVWLSWPTRRATWPGQFRPIPRKFAEIAAQISRWQKVRINLARSLERSARDLIRRAGAEMENVEFFHHPTNDAWCRDHGPIFLRNDLTGEVALTDWDYNAWGRKYHPYDDDNRVPSRIAKALGMRRFRQRMVLEGGSIDGNGRGMLLTTEACLLNKNRNPRLSRAEIERKLREALGASTVLWLGDGIVGDDTDGHVDDLSRFFSATGVVTAVETDRRDANHRALAENLTRLRAWRSPAGARLKVVELPMPAPCFFRGKRLPASYANFLVINRAVLMPAFRQPRRDARALEVLAGCFPGREIVAIDCLELVLGRGTLHCISQQQPL